MELSRIPTRIEPALASSFDSVDPQLRDPELEAVAEHLLRQLKAATYRVALGLIDERDDDDLDTVMRMRFAAAPPENRATAARKLQLRIDNPFVRKVDLAGLTASELALPNLFKHPRVSTPLRRSLNSVRRDIAAEGRLGALGAVRLASAAGASLPPQSDYLYTRALLKVDMVRCVDEQGWDAFGSDEIDMGGIAVDASGNVTKIPSKKVHHDFDSGETKDFEPDWTVQNFKVTEGGDSWPKTYSVKLVMVERDWGNFPAWLENLYGKARDALASYAGSFWEGLSYVVNWVLDKLLGWIKDLWEDDLISSATYTLTHVGPRASFGGNARSNTLMTKFYGNGAKYKVYTYWGLGNPG